MTLAFKSHILASFTLRLNQILNTVFVLHVLALDLFLHKILDCIQDCATCLLIKNLE